ncbi:hypothetical protein AGMMS50230_13870 [Spirochaetia bacterium]|nr:hypothetical protein AGMMS50230_13870 [Spirochaetia bacterium]
MLEKQPEPAAGRAAASEGSPEASLAIQVLPKTASGDEVIRIVDAVIAYIKGTGLNTFVGPFETTVEGSFDQLCEIAREAQLISIREGAGAVSTYMKWAYNPGEGVWSIDKKVSKHHVP